MSMSHNLIMLIPLNKNVCICLTSVTPFILQTMSLQRLEKDNQEAARRLGEVVHQGELLLERIQLALHEIAQLQLESQALETGSKT